MFTDSASLLKFMFGRLTLDVLPLHEPIVLATFCIVMLGGATVVALLTYFRLWGYLWSEWFTSVDHKRISVMYKPYAFSLAFAINQSKQ